MEKIMNQYLNKKITNNHKIVMSYLGIKFTEDMTIKEASELIHAEINKRKSNIKPIKVEEKNNEVWKKR